MDSPLPNVPRSPRREPMQSLDAIPHPLLIHGFPLATTAPTIDTGRPFRALSEAHGSALDQILRSMMHGVVTGVR